MTVTPPPVTPNLPAIRAFVAALRSGLYKQGPLALIHPDLSTDGYRYCCLGVACVVAKERGVELTIEAPSPGQTVLVRDGAGNASSTVMPPTVADYYRFPELPPSGGVVHGLVNGPYGRPSPNPWITIDPPEVGRLTVTATDANDDYRLSFNEIADAFERTYLTDTAES